MSIGSRVVVTRFIELTSPKLMPWRDHVFSVVGTQPAQLMRSDPALTRAASVWHLVSANNRPLARGAAIHESVEDCFADARQAIESACRMTVQLVEPDEHGPFAWYLTLAGASVVTCSRWVPTVRDREHSIALALASLATAKLRPTARLMNPSSMVRDDAPTVAANALSV